MQAKNISIYSLAKDKNTKLSANFKVKEFKCKDGSDVILIDPILVDILQKIRNHFKKPVKINSGYRTFSYNKQIGGAFHSQHCYGTACDIRITGVSPSAIAEYVETLLNGWGGIGVYDTFVHIDTRSKRSRWKD